MRPEEFRDRVSKSDNLRLYSPLFVTAHARAMQIATGIFSVWALLPWYTLFGARSCETHVQRHTARQYKQILMTFYTNKA